MHYKTKTAQNWRIDYPSIIFKVFAFDEKVYLNIVIVQLFCFVFLSI